MKKDKAKKNKKEPKKSKGERRMEKELLWIIVFFLFLVIVFLVSGVIFKELNKVEYGGLVFTKERVGDIPVYHYYYYFTGAGGSLNKYNLYVRNNPLENDVTVESGDIEFRPTKIVYVSINSTGIEECQESVLAVGGLVQFLNANTLTVRTGNPDPVEAEEKGQEYITCAERPADRPVIIIREGPESRINIGEMCYTIEVANCEVLKATEKFIIHTIIDNKVDEDQFNS